MPLLGVVDLTVVAMLVFVHVDETVHKLGIAIGWVVATLVAAGVHP